MEELQQLAPEELATLFRERAAAGLAEYTPAMDKLEQFAREYNPIALVAAAAFDSLLPDRPEDDDSRASQAQLALFQAIVLRATEDPQRAEGDAPDLKRPNPETVTEVRHALNAVSDAFPAIRLLRLADAGDDPGERRLLALYERIRLATQFSPYRVPADQVWPLAESVWEALDQQMEVRHGVRPLALIGMWKALREQRYRQLDRHLELRRMMPEWADPHGLGDRVRYIRPTLAPGSRDLSRVQPGGMVDNLVVRPLVESIEHELIEVFSFTLGDAITGYTASLVQQPSIAPQAEGGHLTPPEDLVRGILDGWTYAPGELAQKNRDHFFLNNPVWAKPLVRLGNDRWLWPGLHAFGENLLDMLESLLTGDEVLRNRYHDRRSDFLENEVARLLGDALSGAALYRGTLFRLPDDPAVQYESDLIAVLDSHALLEESKSGGREPGANRGGRDSVAGTVRELIEEPARQSERAAAMLANRGIQHFSNTARTETIIDTTAVRRVIRLSVTLERLDALGARWTELREAGLLAEDVRPAPVLTLPDLQDICLVLSRPAELLHYLSARERIEVRGEEPADEVDILALYLQTGFSAGARHRLAQRQRAAGLGAGLRKQLARYWRGEQVQLPRRHLPLWLNAVLDQLEGERPSGWTLASSILLALEEDAQESLGKDIDTAVEEFLRHSSDGRTHLCSATVGFELTDVDAGRTTLDIVVVPPSVTNGGALDELVRRASELAAQEYSTGTAADAFPDALLLAVDSVPGSTGRAFRHALMMPRDILAGYVASRTQAADNARV